MKLTEIKVDNELQSRAEINEQVIAEYTEVIRNGGKMPPVTVFFDGKNNYLADGWHRYFAHKKAGFADIEADVKKGSRREAIFYSVGANSNHGLRRTNADKRKAGMTLLEDIEWSELSDVEIAKACGVSSMFIGNLRKEHLPVDEQPAERKVKRGDTEYKMDISNIGAKPKEAEPEYDEQEGKIEELATELNAIAEENEELKAKLAVGLMEGTDEDKKKASQIIDEQRALIKSLEAQVKGLTASRDAYQIKNAELIKQVNYWKKQAQK
jgi:ParB-like chromosome segregation protein Spo0J